VRGMCSDWRSLRILMLTRRCGRSWRRHEAARSFTITTMSELRYSYIIVGRERREEDRTWAKRR
jgi:hypothetical protein